MLPTNGQIKLSKAFVYRKRNNVLFTNFMKSLNLLHWWKFNDNSDPVIDYGSGGNDLVSVGSPGILYKDTGAVLTEQDFSVRIVNDISTNRGLTANTNLLPTDFTMGGFFKYNGSLSLSPFFMGQANNGVDRFFIFNRTSSQRIAVITDSNSFEATLGVNNTDWYHIVLTKSGTTYRLFVNGLFNASGTLNAVVSSADFSMPILYSVVQSLDTSYDHCFISEDILSDSDINKMYTLAGY